MMGLCRTSAFIGGCPCVPCPPQCPQMRDDRQYGHLVQNANASGDKDRAGEDGRYLAQQTDNPSAARGPVLRQSHAGAARNPNTPGWDQRPGADLRCVDQLAGGWFSNVRTAAPESAKLALGTMAVAIITAFGLGWFCGSTWYFSRTIGAKTPSRTVSVPLHRTSGKAALTTGSIAGSISRSISTSQAESRKTSFAAVETSAPAPSTDFAQQHMTTSQAPNAPLGEMPGPRLMPFPETRPATIDGWSVRDVHDGAAVLVGTDGVWTVKPGDYVPGVGRIDSITHWGDRWIVVTTVGLISTQ
jgi:hypothetical protein